MIHCFDVDIARVYGVNAAILLQNLGHWIQKNKANETNYHDGNYWTYNSRRAYRELFPYMSERQIDTAFKKLIDDGIVITGNYNELKYDRTLWYALTEKGKSILHFDGMERDEMSNQFPQNVKPIPNINTDNKPNINTDNVEKTSQCDADVTATKKKEKPVKHKYGEYNNVLLSDTELEKLKAEFPNDYQSRIERLSGYMQSTGKSYKDHLATIRNWARRDNKNGNSGYYQQYNAPQAEQPTRHREIDLDNLPF